MKKRLDIVISRSLKVLHHLELHPILTQSQHHNKAYEVSVFCFFQPAAIASFCNYDIHINQFCTTCDNTTPSLQPLPLLAPMCKSSELWPNKHARFE